MPIITIIGPESFASAPITMAKNPPTMAARRGRSRSPESGARSWRRLTTPITSMRMQTPTTNGVLP